ncbi:MAG: hypothetical protein HY736_22915 [Verrucomicrobia bacterium]|nr:hypothetical protein [Verrucomicrobiota bacterium]
MVTAKAQVRTKVRRCPSGCSKHIRVRLLLDACLCPPTVRATRPLPAGLRRRTIHHSRHNHACLIVFLCPRRFSAPGLAGRRYTDLSRHDPSRRGADPRRTQAHLPFLRRRRTELRLHEGRAEAAARVGGPDTAGDGGKFVEDFLEHCLRGKNHATGQTGTPLDFIAFHAKGSTPVFLDGHVRMGIGGQLKTIDAGFARVARYPELKGKPVIIGESDPDGCAACQGPHLGYRNSTMYSSYTAASFARKHLLAGKHGVNFEGATTWAFEFEDQPYFAGFRAMASNGLTLPVFNVHRMMARMTGQRVETRSSADVGVDEIIKSGVRAGPDVAALASLDAAKRQLAVLIWHYHDDDVAGADAAVALSLAGLPSEAAQPRVTHYRVDERHSNAYALWKTLGSPVAPSRAQYAQLEAASRLALLNNAATATTLANGGHTLTFTLPRQAVSLVLLNW